MLELTEVLLPSLPVGLDRLFYSTTGAEAVENAVKVARCFTGKHAVVSRVPFVIEMIQCLVAMDDASNSYFVLHSLLLLALLVLNICRLYFEEATTEERLVQWP